jgi:hypothetical protein
MIYLRTFVVFTSLLGAASFSPSGLSNSHIKDATTRTKPQDDLAMALFGEPEKKSGLETAMRSKLVTESIAPWRTLRLFLYGALGSGAFVGGLINTSGAIAGSNNPEFNLNTEVL